MLFSSCNVISRSDGTTFSVTRAECVLSRRPVRGDVVTFTHDFTLRRAAPREASELRDDLSHRAEISETDLPPTHQTQELVPSVPSNPTVYRIRTDVSWEDIIRNRSPNIRQFQNGTSPSLTSLILFSFANSKFNSKSPTRKWSSIIL